MMNIKRTLLYGALALIAFMLWTHWQQEHFVKETKLIAEQEKSDEIPLTSEKKAVPSHTPPTDILNKDQKTQLSAIDIPDSRVVHVKTDVMGVTIDRKGGNVVQVELLNYPRALKSDQPITLLSNDESQYFVAQSGLISSLGPDGQNAQALYEATQSHYVLSHDHNQLKVDLTWKSPEGIEVTKTFTFKKGRYDTEVSYHIKNNSSLDWQGNFYAQLKQKAVSTEKKMFAMHTFTGASYSTSEQPYKKVTYKKLSEANIDQTSKGGWLAFQKRYFVAAFAPSPDQVNHYYSRHGSGDIYTMGAVGPTLTVKPGEQVTTSAKLYVGPEIAKNLEGVAKHLELTVDYGWLWFLSVAIFWLMTHIHNVVGNWGVSIILVTVLIKLLFYKLSATSYRSMARMQKLTPQMNRIREQYKDDKQKLSQETMALYRREKVNPLGGCLPMIIQIPFFIALYYVLIESVQLRHAPFIFWIQDLSVKDPFYVLPLLMGASMFFQQRLNPTPPDPMQAKVMMFMPVLFTVFFLNFPSGLVLYWLTNNCLSILQQWWIMKTIKNEKGKPKSRNKKK